MRGYFEQGHPTNRPELMPEFRAEMLFGAGREWDLPLTSATSGVSPALNPAAPTQAQECFVLHEMPMHRALKPWLNDQQFAAIERSVDKPDFLTPDFRHSLRTAWDLLERVHNLRARIRAYLPGNVLLDARSSRAANESYFDA
jgi:hypothetical protein